MNAAEKRLAAAQKTVDEAKAALGHAQREVRDLGAQEASVDQAIRAAIDEATRAGKPPSVDDARDHARGLADKRATAEQVVATLTSVVRERGEARDRQIAEDFPELAEAVERDLNKLRAEQAAVVAAYEEAMEPLRAAERGLVKHWAMITAPLPAPLRPASTNEDGGVDPVVPTPNVGLGHYVPEPHWPAWARKVVNQSREMATDETERLRLSNVPMGAS
jgi:hypothetical protein